MKKVLFLAIVCMACLALLAGGVWATDLCVSNATELQTALSTAAGNTEDDLIKVVQGTYSGHFTYYSTKGHNITLLGGYTAGCASRVVDPTNTVLDGGGTYQVLSLGNNDNGGNVQVDGFTIQHGTTNSYGGGLWADSHNGQTTGYMDSGDVTITNNIITENSAHYGGGVYAYSRSDQGAAGTVTLSNNRVSGNSCTYDGGGVYAQLYSTTATAGTLILVNNTITDNSAPTDGHGGGVFAISYSPVTPPSVTITNNTITGHSTGFGGGAYLQIWGSSGGTINCYNNIIWGNAATFDGGDVYLVKVDGNFAYAHNNDVTRLAGSDWDEFFNNSDADPLFIDSAHGDYHLSTASPCMDTGLNSAPGLPVDDFDGDARIIDGDNNGTATVDMGADEFFGGVITGETPSSGTIFSACSLISKYQPSFQWTVLETFKSFTIYFSTSDTDFSTKGVLITKANIKGTKFSYIPSSGVWKKLLTAAWNGGAMRNIYWKVVGKRQDKSLEESGIRSFNIDDPYYPEIQSPEEAAELPAATPPTFIFYTNCNVKFRLEISPLVGFTDPKKIKAFSYSVKDPNVTTIFTKPLSSGQWKGVQKLIGTNTGYFRIRGWDVIKREADSATQSFTITTP